MMPALTTLWEDGSLHISPGGSFVRAPAKASDVSCPAGRGHRTGQLPLEVRLIQCEVLVRQYMSFQNNNPADNVSMMMWRRSKLASARRKSLHGMLYTWMSLQARISSLVCAVKNISCIGSTTRTRAGTDPLYAVPQVLLGKKHWRIVVRLG